MDAQALTNDSLNGSAFKKLWGKVNKYMLIVAIIHFAFTFLTDGRIFSIEPFYFEVPLPLDGLSSPYYYAAAKILAFISLFIFYQILYLICHAFKTKNKRLLFDFVFPFAVMLAFYLIQYVLCFPGVYKIDDASMYALATHLYPFYWHNYLTSLFYMVGLTLFPLTSGQMLLMDIFVALIFAYIFYRLSGVLTDKKANKWKYLLFAVALSPFIITITLESFRTYMYAILNLFVFAFLIFERIQKRQLTWIKFILLALGIAVLAQWRSESILYLIFTPFLLYTVYYRNKRIKIALLFMVSVVGLYWAVNLPQQVGNTKFYNNDYLIVSTTRPLSVLLNLDQTYNYPDSQQDVENINKVINLDQLKAFPFESLSFQSWNTINNQGRLTESASTEQAQNDYLKAFVNIVIHNPDVFLKERLDLFIKTNYLNDVFQMDFGKQFQRIGQPALGPYLTFNQTLEKLHIIPKPMKSTGTAYMNAITFEWAKGIYTVIPSLILAVFLIIISIRYKAWLTFLIELIILSREFLVFMTSPSTMINYYMPTTVLSLFLGVLLIIFVIYNKKAKEKKKLFV